MQEAIGVKARDSEENKHTLASVMSLYKPNRVVPTTPPGSVAEKELKFEFFCSP